MQGPSSWALPPKASAVRSGRGPCRHLPSRCPGQRSPAETTAAQVRGHRTEGQALGGVRAAEHPGVGVGGSCPQEVSSFRDLGMDGRSLCPLGACSPFSRVSWGEEVAPGGPRQGQAVFCPLDPTRHFTWIPTQSQAQATSRGRGLEEPGKELLFL